MATRCWDGYVSAEWNLDVRLGSPDDTRTDRWAVHDDDALVRACLDGRPEAFEAIVRRHQRQVYSLCFRFAGNHADAADLAQDVFIRAYRGLAGFKGRSSFGTWLYRIAVNVSLSRSARNRSDAPLAAAGIADIAEAPDEVLLREERAAEVRAAIARLPRKQRATLILRVYHELPHEEIAAILGGSVGAAKTNFFHALTNLRKLLR